MCLIHFFERSDGTVRQNIAILTLDDIDLGAGALWRAGGTVRMAATCRLAVS